MTVLHLGRRELAQGIETTPERRVEAAVGSENEMGETEVRKARARRLDVALHVGSLAPEAHPCPWLTVRGC